MTNKEYLLERLTDTQLIELMIDKNIRVVTIEDYKGDREDRLETSYIIPLLSKEFKTKEDAENYCKDWLTKTIETNN